ncbi:MULTISPECIES: hypothetical protein [unclassified Microbacterium]|uniref:hypothetical protein n=1 Tax=unclassified Microbacterium TaxID=2609290 RepID=UPI003866A1C0
MALGVLLGADAASRTVQVSIAGGDGAWMDTLSDTDWSKYLGSPVWVLRDPITGQALLCLGLAGAATAPEDDQDDVTLPSVGYVSTDVPLTVTANGRSFICNNLWDYVPVPGDTVLLYWPTPADPWVLGQTGTPAPPSAPAVPGDVAASRAGSDVVVSWARSDGSTASTVRYSVNDGAWKTRRGLTGTTAHVPIQQGQSLRVEVQANGPGGSSAWSDSVTVSWSKPSPPPPKTVTRTVTITPTWSGSYRHRYDQWDRWNTNRYGGRSTLWQGSKYGSGEMTGLAVYGNRIRDLDADEIVSIELTLRGVGLNSDLPSIVVQGSPHGSKPGNAPSSSGPTVSGQTGASSAVKVKLPAALREALRTGAAKGLATVGSGYGGVRGTSAGDGMALKITYKVTI